jgi:hypothetical protein
MPIDANIYGQQIQPRFNTPFENLSGILQLRNQQEAGRALQEQRLASAEERRQKAEELQQHQADLAAIDAAVKGGKTPEEVLALTPGHLQAMMRKQFADADKYNADAKESKAKAEKDELAYAANLASSVKAWKPYGPDAMLNAAQVALQTAKAHGHDVSQLEGVLAQDPTKLEPMLDGIIAQFQGPPKPEGDYTIGNTRFQGGTNKPLVTAPKEPTKPDSAQEFEYRNSLSPEQRAAYDKQRADDANLRRPVTNVNMAGTNPAADRDTNAQQLVDGNLLPSTLSKRGTDFNAMLALANRKSIEQTGHPLNLNKLTLDYESARRFVGTMDGAQMVRFNGLADSVVNTIDEVKSLANELKQGDVQKWNQAKRSTILQVYGNTPQSDLAARYIAAVGTLQEEFANLANGGFAPTESAWRLSNNQIKSDYGFKDMTASLSEVQRLINYRVKAIADRKPVSVQGPGGNYTNPQTQQQTGTESGDHRYWRLNGKQGPEPK